VRLADTDLLLVNRGKQAHENLPRIRLEIFDQDQVNDPDSIELQVCGF
jgi:hypothetical protein